MKGLGGGFAAAAAAAAAAAGAGSGDLAIITTANNIISEVAEIPIGGRIGESSNQRNIPKAELLRHMR